jgi:hypothetical protein
MRAREAAHTAEFARAEEALVVLRVRAVATIFADCRAIPADVFRLVFELLDVDLEACQGENGEWTAELELNHCCKYTLRQLVPVMRVVTMYRSIDTPPGTTLDDLDLGGHPALFERRLVNLPHGNAFGRILSTAGVAETTTVMGHYKGVHVLSRDMGLFFETDLGWCIPMSCELVSVEISGPTLAIVQRAKFALHAMIEHFERKARQIGVH